MKYKKLADRESVESLLWLRRIMADCGSIATSAGYVQNY